MAKEKIYYCVGCGTTHPRGSFYVSYNRTHANGVLPYCKKFIKNESYKSKDKSDNTVGIRRFQNMLMQLNIPFLKETFDSASTSGGDIVGKYFTMFNSLPQNRGLAWINSDFGDEEFDTENGKSLNDDHKDNLDDFLITPEMTHRWGDDKSNIEIRDLEKFYRDMHITHTIVTPQHEKALILICKLQLKLDKCLEQDDMGGFSKTHGEYQKLLTSSGLRPIDKIGGAEASGIRSFSQIFEEIEKDGFIRPTPVEENQDIVDKTIQYIMNYTKKLLNKQILVEPPVDTPKVSDGEIDG